MNRIEYTAACPACGELCTWTGVRVFSTDLKDRLDRLEVDCSCEVTTS